MIEEKTLLTDHINLSNREFRKKYAEGLKIIEISDGFEKSNPSFETSNTGKYIAIKDDENKYLVFYSKGTNIISENYSVISVFDLDQEIELNKIYENWVVEKPALFTLHNDGTWSMNQKGIINLDSKVEIEKLIKPVNSIIETKPLFEKIEKPEIKEEFNQKTKELIEVTNELDDIEVESLIIKTPPKIETKTNKKVKLSSPFKLSIVAIIIWVAIFYFRESSKILDSNSIYSDKTEISEKAINNNQKTVKNSAPKKLKLNLDNKKLFNKKKLKKIDESSLNTLIIPAVSVGEAKIGEKLSISSFIKLMGNQSRTINTSPDVYVWGINRNSCVECLTLLIKTDGKNKLGKVTEIYVNTEIFKTKEGIKVGSNISELKQKYPNGKKIEDCMDSDYCWKIAGATFSIYNDKIFRISIYEPNNLNGT